MSQPDTPPPGAGLEVEVRVGWLLPPLRTLAWPEDPQDLVEALAAMHAEQQRIVDFRGPAATAAAVLRVVADQLDPPPVGPTPAQRAAAMMAGWAPSPSTMDATHKEGETT